jgi:sugar transferase (PEP-CTERM/EpsH1 system associated)
LRTVANQSNGDAAIEIREDFRRPAAAAEREPSCLRVLHVVDRIGVGGTELNVLKLLRGLSPQGFEQQLFSIRGGSDSAGPERELGFEPLSAGAGEGGFQFAVPRLVRVMRACRPQIVHSRNWGAIEAVVAARLAGVPIAVHSEHGYELEMFDGLPLRRRLFRRFAYGRADAVMTVTRELRDYHARQAWFSPDRIRVIYNGVDTERFQPRSELHPVARERLRLPATSFVIGSVGRLVPIKDYPTLFDAAAKLVERGFDARVLLVGSGPELEHLKGLVDASRLLAGRVTFAGACLDVPEMLAAMDAFVLPSVREGMSNTLLEAMAAGLPVIAMRVGGNPEIVEDGRSGWLLAPRDVDGLAHRVEQLASSPEMGQRLGSAARRRVFERFTLAHMLANYQDLYRELAERRGLGKVR